MQKPDFTLDELTQKIALLSEKLDKKELEGNLINLQQKSTDPNLWDDEQNAKKILSSLSHAQQTLDNLNSLSSDLKNIEELSILVADDKTLEAEVTTLQKKLEKKITQLETRTYLSGKFDSFPAIISIHSGAGGTEAMDWAGMLSRMYQRFFEKNDWSFKLIDESLGEEAGIKSAVLEINHPFAYGYLKHERGTHRLVRQSPFNSDNLRQTSFANVEVSPLVDEDIDQDIKDDEIDIEFYRSGGPGGQNVNKVNTAVRIKHRPTGLVVEAQTHRTQEQNRKQALNILKAKLYELEEQKRKEEMQKVTGEFKVASFGNQIRSYVLHPYKLIKDHRTEHESKDPDSVLDGDISDFLEAELSQL